MAWDLGPRLQAEDFSHGPPAPDRPHPDYFFLHCVGDLCVSRLTADLDPWALVSHLWARSKIMFSLW